jgi:hypothetical protein
VSDTELLDFLDDSTNGDLWIARESTTGRGYRLHNIASNIAYIEGLSHLCAPTVREAITLAINEAGS